MVFTRRWYFSPNSIIIRNSWGPSAVTRQLCAFHSTFDLSLCLGLIYLAYIFCHSCHPAVHTPLLPPTWMPPTLPPSAAIVISLPSTGPLIRLGWHVPRLYLSRRKWNPEPIYGASPPNAPSPHALPLSLTLHLCTSSSSAPCCSPSLLRHGVISLPLSARMNPHPAPPRSLSFFYLFLSGLKLPSLPLPLFILPHPTRPVATAVLLEFMGLLQQLPGRKKRQDLKKKNGETIWEEPCGEK